VSNASTLTVSIPDPESDTSGAAALPTSIASVPNPESVEINVLPLIIKSVPVPKSLLKILISKESTSSLCPESETVVKD
jgi:hypothetical protein